MASKTVPSIDAHCKTCGTVIEVQDSTLPYNSKSSLDLGADIPYFGTCRCPICKGELVIPSGLYKPNENKKYVLQKPEACLCESSNFCIL